MSHKKSREGVQIEEALLLWIPAKEAVFTLAGACGHLASHGFRGFIVGKFIRESPLFWATDRDPSLPEEFQKTSFRLSTAGQDKWDRLHPRRPHGSKGRPVAPSVPPESRRRGQPERTPTPAPRRPHDDTPTAMRLARWAGARRRVEPLPELAGPVDTPTRLARAAGAATPEAAATSTRPPVPAIENPPTRPPVPAIENPPTRTPVPAAEVPPTLPPVPATEVLPKLSRPVFQPAPEPLPRPARRPASRPVSFSPPPPPPTSPLRSPPPPPSLPRATPTPPSLPRATPTPTSLPRATPTPTSLPRATPTPTSLPRATPTPTSLPRATAPAPPAPAERAPTAPPARTPTSSGTIRIRRGRAAAAEGTSEGTAPTPSPVPEVVALATAPASAATPPEPESGFVPSFVPEPSTPDTPLTTPVARERLEEMTPSTSLAGFWRKADNIRRTIECVRAMSGDGWVNADELYPELRKIFGWAETVTKGQISSAFGMLHAMGDVERRKTREGGWEYRAL